MELFKYHLKHLIIINIDEINVHFDYTFQKFRLKTNDIILIII